MNGRQSWAAIAVRVTTYGLIISEMIRRVAAALGGAALMAGDRRERGRGGAGE